MKTLTVAISTALVMTGGAHARIMARGMAGQLRRALREAQCWSGE